MLKNDPKFKELPEDATEAYSQAFSILKIHQTDPESTQKLMKLLHLSASKANKDAQFALGAINFHGTMNQPKDYKAAFYWLNLAAEQKHSEAYVKLAEMHWKGCGIPKDQKEALRYMQLVDSKEVIPKTQFDIGRFYEQGLGGKKDYKEAAKWYMYAARQNHIIAQCNLGALFCMGGDGIPKDYNEAAIWLGLSAKAGLSNAQYHMSILSLYGLGLKQDFHESFRWANLSAAQNDSDGRVALGVLHYNGLGTAINYQEAFRQFLLSAKQKNKTAIDHLIETITKKYKFLQDDILPAFQFFIETSHIQPLESLLKIPDILPENQKSELLSYAIGKRQHQFTHTLLKSKINPNIVSKNKSPLQLALNTKDKSFIELLLEHKAVPTERELKSFIPFIQTNMMEYIQQGKIGFLEILSRKILESITEEMDSETLISLAQKESRDKEMKKLLEKEKMSLNVLQIAVLFGKTNIVKMLLEKGFSPHEPNAISPISLSRVMKSHYLTKILSEAKEQDCTSELKYQQKEFKKKYEIVNVELKALEKIQQEIWFSHRKKLTKKYKDIRFVREYAEKLGNLKNLTEKAKPFQKDISNIKKYSVRLHDLVKKIESDKKYLEGIKNSKKTKKKNKTSNPPTTLSIASLSLAETEENQDHGVEDWEEEKPVQSIKVSKILTSKLKIAEKKTTVTKEEKQVAKSVTPTETVTSHTTSPSIYSPSSETSLVCLQDLRWTSMDVSPPKNLSQPLSTTALLLETSLNMPLVEKVKPKLNASAPAFHSKHDMKTVAPLVAMSKSKNIKLNDLLSDHGYQTMIFEYQGNDCYRRPLPLLQIVGMTYNLLDRAFSKEENYGKYSNNPWNISENFTAYWGRKYNQALNKIFQILAKNSVDFMFLQEIDFLNPHHQFKFSWQEQIIIINKLKKDFIEKLSMAGYHILISTTSDSSNQPMATIFRHTTFQYLSSHPGYGRLPDYQGINRAWVTPLLHRISGRVITLINLHLSYTGDYTNAIIQLMEMVSGNGIVFAGGDTNSTPKNINGLLTVNPIHGVTNIQMLGNKLSLKDEKGRDKCYDGFFARIPKEEQVWIRFGDCEVFYLKEKDVIASKIVNQSSMFTKIEEPSADPLPKKPGPRTFS